MRKAFGFILTVVLAMSLIGCSDKKATTTEKVTSTEVKATATEAPTTEVPTTKATVSDATATDATATDATATDATVTSASSTDATVPEASSNDAERLSSSSEITENVVITENVNQKKVSSEIIKETKNEKQKTIILGYYDEEAFAVYITENGGNEIEVHLNKTPEFDHISFMFNYNFSEISLEQLSEYGGVGGGTGNLIDGVLEFTITYDNGRIVTVKVYAPEA